jgi:hypothetical protein
VATFEYGRQQSYRRPAIRHRLLRFTLASGRIVEIEAIGDPDRVRRLDLSVLE